MYSFDYELDFIDAVIEYTVGPSSSPDPDDDSVYIEACSLYIGKVDVFPMLTREERASVKERAWEDFTENRQRGCDGPDDCDIIDTPNDFWA
jgi:hypothetical protein